MTDFERDEFLRKLKDSLDKLSRQSQDDLATISCSNPSIIAIVQSISSLAESVDELISECAADYPDETYASAQDTPSLLRDQQSEFPDSPQSHVQNGSPFTMTEQDDFASSDQTRRASVIQQADIEREQLPEKDAYHQDLSTALDDDRATPQASSVHPEGQSAGQFMLNSPPPRASNSRNQGVDQRPASLQPSSQASHDTTSPILSPSIRQPSQEPDPRPTLPLDHLQNPSNEHNSRRELGEMPITSTADQPQHATTETSISVVPQATDVISSVSQPVTNPTTPRRITTRSLSSNTPKNTTTLPSRKKGLAEPKARSRLTSSRTIQPTNKPQDSSPSKGVRSITLPLSRTQKMSSDMEACLEHADTEKLCPAQWRYFEKNEVMPLTSQQWDRLEDVVQQLSRPLMQYGGVVLQPRWEDATSSQTNHAKTKKVSIQCSAIGAVRKESQPGSWSVIDAHDSKIAVQIITEDSQSLLAEKSPSPPAEESIIDIFEQTLLNEDRSPSLYARDVDGDEYTKCMALLRDQSRLVNLNGNRLVNLKEGIPGISSPYMYIGSPDSAFSMHIEDENLMSINRLLCGQKHWTIIPPGQKGKVEVALKKIFYHQTGSNPTCDQLGRHTRAYIFQHHFKDMGVKPTNLIQKAGQVVLTATGAYHQGFNITCNAAEAVNYAPKSWSPLGYQFCDPSCARFYPGPEWKPLIISETLTQADDVSQTTGEQITVADLVKTTANIAATPIQVLSDKKPRLEGEKDDPVKYIGGKVACTASDIILSLATDQHLKDLRKAVEDISKDIEGTKATRWERSGLAVWRRGRMMNLGGEILSRVASLHIHRAIQKIYQENRERRDHHNRPPAEKTVPRKRKANSGLGTEVTDDVTTNKNLKRIVEEYALQTLKRMGLDAEQIEQAKDIAIQDIKQADRDGHKLERLVHSTADAVVLSIPTELLQRFKNLQPFLQTVTAECLRNLRPWLAKSCESLEPGDLGHMYEELVKKLDLQ